MRKALNANPGIKYLSVVHSETPSGTLNPVQEIGKIAHEFGVLTMVDTVSGLGSEMLSPEDWGMDIAIAGPQKCLSGPPGSALISVSPAAWEAMETSRRSRCAAAILSILDWKTTWLEKRTFPYTPLVTEMYALESVLTQILDEGHGAACRAAPADRRAPAGPGSRRSVSSSGRRARRSPRPA